MYVMTINEKETVNLKERKSSYMEDFRGEKGTVEMMQLFYNLKNKKNNEKGRMSK